MHVLWQSKLEVRLPTVLEVCTTGGKDLDSRNLLNQAMSEETWHNKRGNHKQPRGMQELMQQIPRQAATPVEKLVEVTEQTPINKQSKRENTSGENEEKKLKTRKPTLFCTCLEMIRSGLPV